MTLATMASLLLAASAGGDCNFGTPEQLAEDAEPLVLHREQFRVPRDPVGSKYEYACVRVKFKINELGEPIDVGIDKSSGNRAIDIAARETLKKFRFDVSRQHSGKEFSLIFDYPPRDAM